MQISEFIGVALVQTSSVKVLVVAVATFRLTFDRIVHRVFYW